MSEPRPRAEIQLLPCACLKVSKIRVAEAFVRSGGGPPWVIYDEVGKSKRFIVYC
jgi:hypothetical protein